MNPGGYFDFNATTPLAQAAREAWLRAADLHWHNPSSLYREAGASARLVEEARERAAALLDVDPARVLFTGGASEANNTVFAWAARSLPVASRFAVSPVEHPSVRAAAVAWAGQTRVDTLPAAPGGAVEEAAVEQWLEQAGDCAGLVSVMAANNESGVLQPWRAIAERCARRGVLFHCDASQWAGKMPLDGLGECALVTLSSHKFGGPKGCGILIVPGDWDPGSGALIHGGPQEGGRRAGTEDAASIAAMAAALESLADWDGAAKAAALRDEFEAALIAAEPETRVVGRAQPRLWNTSLTVMPRHHSLKWVGRLSQKGFAISTGSACSAGREGSSVVLQALGAEPGELRRVLRFSAGWETAAADWSALLDALLETAADLDRGGITGAATASRILANGEG
jgi:cysteine desulfurase